MLRSAVMPALWLATWLRLSPAAAAMWAAAATGQAPAVGERLVGVCHRESRCRPTGVHTIDAYLSRPSWAGQVRLKHLDPECQPYRDPEWGTRGSWGLNASDHWPYLPACYEPWILDLTAVSSLVAARKWQRKCTGKTRRGWCRARRRPAQPA